MKRGARVVACCALAMSMALVAAVPVQAQIPELLELLFPPPESPAAPESEPAAQPDPPAQPPSPPAATAPPPSPAEAAASRGTFPLSVPQIPRSPARSTNNLIANLQPALERGVPLEEAILSVVAPFPVAGPSRFSHDWLFPRWTPTPHLHQGTDIFADFGTPIVTSEAGRVIRKGTAGAGGLSVWVKGDSGMAYYYAHLQNWAAGLAVNQRVERGQVIGFVGDSGNARGGAPHLHLQMHPNGGPGTPARDPKAFLDDALRQAEEQAQAFAAQTLATGGIPNTAGAPQQLGIVVTKEVDKLLQSSTMRGPEDLMWFSMMDPTLGLLGLARKGAATGVPQAEQLSEAEAQDQQRREDVREAINSRPERIGQLIAEATGRSTVVVGPVSQALIR